MSNDKKLIGTTIVTAITASLCCITPVLALIAGTSGIASTFSWIGPFRPYLIALTILVLVFGWYQKLKPKKQEIDCECEDEKPKGVNSRMFLVLVTFFAGLMLAFPYYSQIFYPNPNKEVVYVSELNINEIEYNIKGMTCTGCEVHIESEINKLDGIIEVKADYQNANTVVKFDRTKISSDKVKEAILSTGYKIVDLDEQNKEMEMYNSNISFYEVGLVCNAAPSLGCGSRAKPILLELDSQDEIKEARLNKEGTVIKIIWQDDIDVNAKKIITESIFSTHKIALKLQNEIQITATNWLNANDVDELSKEEAGIIAKQLIESYRNKGELTIKQEEKLREDIEKQFYSFFLNYESLDQLADTNEYRKLMLKITELSKSYIEEDNIPNIDSLLKSCYGHSEKCNKSGCCKTRRLN
jgi:mercuric ion transport protein